MIIYANNNIFYREFCHDNSPQSVIESRLDAVVPRNSVRLQAELTLKGKGLALGSLSIQPILCLIVPQNLISPPLPPCRYIPCRASHITRTRLFALNLAPDILRLQQGKAGKKLFGKISIGNIGGIQNV